MSFGAQMDVLDILFSCLIVRRDLDFYVLLCLIQINFLDFPVICGIWNFEFGAIAVNMIVDFISHNALVPKKVTPRKCIIEFYKF